MPMDHVTPDRPLVSGRLDAFVQLGKVLAHFGQARPWPGHSVGLTEDEFMAFEGALMKAHVRNAWFTPAEVRHAATGLSRLLSGHQLGAWLKGYPALTADRPVCTVGIIMAGNVPFVGFHDLLCVLLSGHRAKVKTSSDDAGLTPALLQLLGRFAPALAAMAEVRPGQLGDVDAMIATGSNNTARYFEFYFGKMPHIIRKGRTSVAVIDGSESEAELAALGEDVFRYFGLGCRNVGKVFVPEGYDLDRLFAAFYAWKEIIHHHKYANNYDYNRAVWLLDRAPITENGFLVMKEESALNSPVAALYFERYADRAALQRRLDMDADKIQCIVGHGHIPFGAAQYPGPSDYADNVDTMRFLLEQVV